MARYSLPRPDKEALGDHYTNKAGILAFILGTGVFNFRTAMGKNEARIFLDDNFTKNQMTSIFGKPWQGPTKVEMIEFIINLGQLATLVVEVDQDDKSSPFGMNSQELYDLLALDLFALPSSNEDDGEDVGEDVGEDAEISSVVQEVRDLCESHKDNYHVPGCCRNVLRNIIVFCGYVIGGGRLEHVPSSYKVDGVNLAKCISNWRNDGQLDEYPWAKALLTHAGFLWGNLHDLAFSRWLSKILQCHQQHGVRAQDYYTPDIKVFLRDLVRKVELRDRSSKLAALSEIGVNIDNFTAQLIYRNQASVNEDNLVLLREYIESYGNCNIPFPDLQLYEPRFNGVYTWLGDIRHQYDNEDLTDEDDIIQKLMSMEVPLRPVPRRRIEDRAGGRISVELENLISQIIGDHVIVRAEFPIDDQRWPRSLDV